MARPGFALRLIYALALLAPVPGMLTLGSGWIGLATGGGPAAFLGSGILVLAALALYRAGEAIFIRRALDARSSGGFGWLLRALGIVGMAIGAACGVGLFAVKPITLAIFHSAGDANIGYFVTGLYLGLGSQLGWPGVLAYELGRFIGPPIDQAERGPSPSFKLRASILGALLVAAVVYPLWRQSYGPQPCGERDLAACVSTVEGGVKRMIPATPKMPVALESALDRIELRRMSGGNVRWKLVESPRQSVSVADLTPGDDEPVRIKIEAIAQGKGVVMTFVVTDGGEETARFTTRFNEARIDGRSLLVDLPGNAESGMRPGYRVGNDTVQLDHVFVMTRRAIGNQLEAAEAALRVDGDAKVVDPDPGAPGGAPMLDNNLDPACAQRVSIGRTSLHAPLVGIDVYQAVTFAAAPQPGPHALTVRGTVVCRGDEVWIVDYAAIRPEIWIRRYGLDGKLQRFVRSNLPAPRGHGGQAGLMDARSVVEREGRMRICRQFIDFDSGVPREVGRETLEIAF